MQDKRPLSRTAIPAQERAARSRLAQIVAGQPFLRGTLQERIRACGKPNCRCARGQKHRSLYLVLSDGKRQRQLYVPRDWEQRVRQWVANHHSLRDLVRQVSELYWSRIKSREE
jgi:hypothetical protein